MTEKDLLDSLRFVDDDLIEEAGLEQLKEEKQKKINGKVIFLQQKARIGLEAGSEFTQ